MPRKLTQEEFIEKAKQIHGDRYDYSKVEYVNSFTKVCIICPKHGEFWQEANSHLRGRGCPVCGDKTKTKEQFIADARKVHGDKYDYSKVEYVNSNTKVCIICPEHGEFWQEANGHLSGKGCPVCSDKTRGLRIKSLEQFIKDAKQVHGDRYDYSKVNYVNNRTKICIICPKHGEFWQFPNSHIHQGSGCRKCYLESLPLSQDEVINRFKQVHGDKYDYSKVNYVNARTKICIICPKHGEFWQFPNIHIQGCGCRKCYLESLPLSQDEVIERFRQTHGNKYDYSKVEYVGIENKVCIICPKHGEFWQVPSSHIVGCGCPICCESKGERILRNLLEKYRINFVYQYRADWLEQQSLDFFIPDYNLGIEYDGEQHFKPVDFSNKLTEEESLEKFKITQERDKRKDEKCAANGVKLFRIKYDEDIEEALTKILKLYNIEILGDKQIV